MKSNNDFDDLTKELKKMYNVVLEGTNETIEKVAKSGAKKMRNWLSEKGSRPNGIMPKETHGLKLANYSKPLEWNDYFSSWTTKIIKGRYPNDTTSGIVYNKKYTLVHLLENGHIVISHGEPVAVTHAFPHVAPVMDYCAEQADIEIQKMIKGL